MTAGQELWRDSCVKLRQQLEEELQGECKKALDTEDFEGFQASVNALCQTYLRKNVSKLVREKLSPHFEHIRSFERAISMSAQLEMAPALFWAGTQAVIQSACRFSDHLDEILDQLVVFYTALPLFNEYMDLFPGNKRLEYPLRDLYDDYGIFCIHAVKYLNKNPTSKYGSYSKLKFMN
jgi:hypothetical protein